MGGLCSPPSPQTEKHQVWVAQGMNGLHGDMSAGIEPRQPCPRAPGPTPSYPSLLVTPTPSLPLPPSCDLSGDLVLSLSSNIPLRAPGCSLPLPPSPGSIPPSPSCLFSPLGALLLFLSKSLQPLPIPFGFTHFPSLVVSPQLLGVPSFHNPLPQPFS